MTTDKNAQVCAIVEHAIKALMSIGCSYKSALSLLASQAVCKMTDLDQLRQMRTEINKSIICNDDSIDEDTRVVIGPCDCIIPEPTH
jgi:hypothetical protein